LSFPALLDAADDPTFVRNGSVAVVYLHLVKRLDFQEFRRVRASYIAVILKMKGATVGNALRLLREGGYIERGPSKVLDAYTYRLMFARKHDEPTSQPAPKRQHG
jgi:hypothetical protein